MKNGQKIEVQGMYLAPASEATHSTFKINTCSNHGDCKNDCLITSGHLALDGHSSVRIDKTRAFYGYPLRFLIQLLKEIKAGSERADRRGDLFQFRCNGTSDILWERYLYIDLFVAATDGLHKFYDYTKIGKRRLSKLPLNYHLTFSIDEKVTTKTNGIAYALAGFSVAVVMPDKEKKKILALNHPRVIDGDLSDHRPQDPQGSIVLLRTKGTLRSATTQFIKDFNWVKSFLDELSDACDA